MNWSSVLIPASILAARLPLDRILVRPRDKAKALEEFAATLPATRPQSSTAALPVISPVVSEMAETTMAPVAPSAASSMPTTEETVTDLKRRLAKEMYRFQLDLAASCKIAGKPCDCCEKHPLLAIESLAEELVPMDPSNPIYYECTQWIKANAEKLTVEASASGAYDKEYTYMAATWREFRKNLLGTERLGAMIAPEKSISLEEAKAEASRMAAEEVEKQWESTEKT